MYKSFLCPASSFLYQVLKFYLDVVSFEVLFGQFAQFRLFCVVPINVPSLFYIIYHFDRKVYNKVFLFIPLADFYAQLADGAQL